MLGPYVNAACVLAGSLSGAGLGPRLSANLRERMPQVFGLAAMGLGIAMIIKVRNLPPVVLALLFGSLMGELCHLETGIRGLATRVRRLVEKIAGKPKVGVGHDEFLEKFVALMVLFCVSGTGVFGSMNEGMTGDPTLLIVKAILDFFTSAIFAAGLGVTVATLAAPQLAIQSGLYLLAAAITPLTTPAMIGDFSACGGLILLATGFRICEIRSFAVANMLPALFLSMPLTALWTRFMG